MFSGVSFLFLWNFCVPKWYCNVKKYDGNTSFCWTCSLWWDCQGDTSGQQELFFFNELCLGTTGTLPFWQFKNISIKIYCPEQNNYNNWQIICWKTWSLLNKVHALTIWECWGPSLAAHISSSLRKIIFLINNTISKFDSIFLLIFLQVSSDTLSWIAINWRIFYKLWWIFILGGCKENSGQFFLLIHSVWTL